MQKFDLLTFTEAVWSRCFQTAPSFTLADNCTVDSGKVVLLVDSKIETENPPRLNNYLSWKLPDIFENDGIIIPLAANILKGTGISICVENLSSAACVITSEGKTFSYSSILITNQGTSLVLHPGATNANKAGKKVDLNILAWYLIFKTLHLGITISSTDRKLLKSASTFIY